MKNLKEKIKNTSVGDIINFFCFLCSVTLGTIAFFIPPTGEIHQSVLLFVAEIGVFSTITRIPDFIKSVAQNHTPMEIKKGDTHIKIGDESDGDKGN